MPRSPVPNVPPAVCCIVTVLRESFADETDDEVLAGQGLRERVSQNRLSCTQQQQHYLVPLFYLAAITLRCG